MGSGVIFRGQWWRAAAILVSVAAVATITTVTSEAHKPITSPYTFNKDVLPIVRDHCAQCHVDGGVAPMSLMTATDATPWAESMRTELIAGHMPPWPVDGPPGRFRNENRLTGRELNVLLTWATGGTPPGDPVNASTPPRTVQWALGKPDLELTLDAVTIPADQQELVKSFVLSAGTTRRRFVRAADLLPGTPAVVRSARIVVKPNEAEPVNDELRSERTLALWQPGDAPVALEEGLGFELPANAQVEVQIRYRKTWQYDGKAMQDQSRIGLYFAKDDAEPVRAITLGADVRAAIPIGNGAVGGVVAGGRAQRALRLLAIRPDADMTAIRATVRIDAGDHATADMFTLRANPAWARRYWFVNTVMLPTGTSWFTTFDAYVEPAILTPPAATPPRAASLHAVTLDVVGAP